MRISTRLWMISFLGSLILIMSLAMTLLVTNLFLNENKKDMDINFPVKNAIFNSNAKVATLRRFEKDILLSIGDKAKQQDYLQKFMSTSEDIKKLSLEINTLLLKSEETSRDIKNEAKKITGLTDSYTSLAAEAFKAIMEKENITLAEAKEKLTAAKESYHSLEVLYEPLIAAYDKSEQADMNALDSFASRLIKILTIIGVILISGCLVGMKISISAITRPLKEFVRVLEKMSQGIIDDTQLNYTSHDEFGATAKSLDKMSARFSMLIKNLKLVGQGDLYDKNTNTLLHMAPFHEEDEIAHAFNGMIKELNLIITGIQKNMVQLNTVSSALHESSQGLAHTSQEQASALEQTSAALEEMNSMMSNSRANAELAHKSSIDNEHSAQQGMKIVKELLKAVNTIDSTNKESFVRLEDSSKQFSEITKVILDIGAKTKIINDIVFQTKLLSFNASVEAARAGEHGKGFSVVAEEVGNLARMSGNAAKEIAQMLEIGNKNVEGIIASTQSNMINMMKSSALSIEEGMKVARECDVILEKILNSAKSLQQNLGEITNASRETAQGIEEVTTAITQIDQETQKIAMGAEQSAAAAATLTTHAQGLNSIISHFKV